MRSSAISLHVYGSEIRKVSRCRPTVSNETILANPKCVQVRTGEEEYHASWVRTHLQYLFSCFCLMASCFICRNLTLPSFKRGVFARNCYFSSMGSIAVFMK